MKDFRDLVLGETIVIKAYTPTVKRRYKQPPDVVRKQRLERRKKRSQRRQKAKQWRQRNKAQLKRRQKLKHYPLGPIKAK